MNQLMDQLGLTKVADSFIGSGFRRGISGGERRRVSVAIELLARPCILLCDEPTTGLDSTTAVKMARLLADTVAAMGTTVVMSVHQPRVEIFHTMTDVSYSTLRPFFNIKASSY